MKNILGRDFMFYIDCETLTGSVTVPLCSAKTVSLDFQSEIREATKAPTSKWATFYYGKNSYSISLDGITQYDDEQLTNLLISVNDALLSVNNALVSVGGIPFDSLNPVFCLENALFDWKYLNWYCEDQVPGFKYRGTVLVEQLSNSWSADGLRDFSGSLRGDGKPERFHTPAPTDLKLVSISSGLPVEDGDVLNIAQTIVDGNYKSGITLLGNPLPTGVYSISTGSVSYAVQPGDTLSEIAQAMVDLLLNADIPALVTAYADDDSVYVILNVNSFATGEYTNHTGNLRSVYLSFVSAKYDFYRVKVIGGTAPLDGWIIDVTSNQPTIILPTGTYTVSVAGMGSDMQYSEYSQTIQITVS